MNYLRNLLMKELQELLRENIVTVKFKKVNGDERILNCTLKGEYIPESSSEKQKKANDKIYSVWSIDDNGWRSFRKDSVISYAVN